MSLIDTCPLPTAIETIPNPSCLQSFGETQKVIFQRLKQADGTLNFLSTTADAHKALATFETLRDASDSTKITVSPWLEGVDFPDTEFRDFGGPDETRNGVPMNLGNGFASMTANIYRVKQTVIKSLKKLRAEAAVGNLGVYLINAQGYLSGDVDDPDTPTKIYPFAVNTLKVGDLQPGKYSTPAMNKVEMIFNEDWADDFYMWLPSFNPRLEIE